MIGMIVEHCSRHVGHGHCSMCLTIAVAILERACTAQKVFLSCCIAPPTGVAIDRHGVTRKAAAAHSFLAAVVGQEVKGGGLPDCSNRGNFAVRRLRGCHLQPRVTAADESCAASSLGDIDSVGLNGPVLWPPSVGGSIWQSTWHLDVGPHRADLGVVIIESIGIILLKYRR